MNLLKYDESAEIDFLLQFRLPKTTVWLEIGFLRLD